MNKTLRRLNRKCIYELGWTLKETAFVITAGLGTALFVALWLNGMLPC